MTNGPRNDDIGDNQPDDATDNTAARADSPDPAAAKPAEPPTGDGNGKKEPPPEAGDPAPDPTIGDSPVLVAEQIRSEVKDALELAEFVVKTGAKKADTRSVPPDLIKIIKVTAGKIKFFEEPKEPIFILASEWTKFELAYYALVEFTSPVTVDTLRNTRNTGKGVFWEASPAQKFTWLLWGITIGFAIAVIFAAAIEVGSGIPGRDAWKLLSANMSPYIKIVIPYFYGGLGACAFLLRTAHNLIAERSFDVRRKPEYLNRILLGMVSGGAIVLLFSPDSEDETVKISAAALGFIAGYSNDFLFNAIERVVAAVLPRVGIESMKRETTAPAPAPLDLPTGGMTLKDLMDRMEAATKPEDKELYKALLVKLRDRL
jgi:hypothetical protein